MDDPFDPAGDGGLPRSLDIVTERTRELEAVTERFARVSANAFAGAIVNGRQFDDVLKSLFLRLSDLTLRLALQPVPTSLASGLSKLVSGLFTGAGGSAAAAGVPAATGFASGGVIGAPTFFPLPSGALGLAGEAGPEAILPLARGADGRLGVAAAGGERAAPIVVNITTADAESFRRSEVFVAGQIARAVARGQRGL